MAICSESEKRKIETALEFVAQQSAVPRGCFFRRQFGFDPVDMGGWDGNAAQERIIRHAEVALRIIRWDGALISPIDVYAIPVDSSRRFWLREHPIGSFRGRSAGKRPSKCAMTFDRVARALHNQIARCCGKCDSIGINPDIIHAACDPGDSDE